MWDLVGDRGGDWSKRPFEMGSFKVGGDPISIAGVIDLEHNNFVFSLPIWSEIPARIR